jgi:endogenous inhibitor of DNA gyrase (YacG/DUF329 family)
MECPICKKPVSDLEPGEKSFYPFCSERCKLIDLGRWLGGKYQIPVVDTDESHDGEVDEDIDR